VLSFDTGGTAAGAARAAAEALKKHPAMILGPLSAEEVPAVSSTVAGRVPIIAFSNDSVLRQPGTWIFGITAGQMTSSILRYARGRGVRTVTVLDDGSPWSVAALHSAGQMESEIGLVVRPLEVRAGTAFVPGSEADDSVLLPNGTEPVLAAARALKGLGAQMLGTLQLIDNRPAALETLDGAWIAGPDPQAFGTFASEFSARNGGTPGTVTALAYDAAGIVNAMRGTNTLNLQGLLSGKGFHGVTGPVRFRTDGSVARDFAILLASKQGYEPVAVSSGS
jgi:hypothetical protein